MHKKYLIFILAVIISSFWPILAFSQDPGNPDTVMVQCLDIVRPNSQVVLDIYVYNDEALGAFSIPLSFPDTVTQLDIICDSVSFAGTRSSSAQFVSDSSSIDNATNRVNVFAVWFAGQLAAGSGVVAKIYFSTGPTWDSTMSVPVDTFAWTKGGTETKLEFAKTDGSGFTPTFEKGCLGQGTGPVPSITVTSPNGGENWQVGSVHDITWTSQEFSGNVKIEYSTDGGSSWMEVIASTEDDGVYSWTVPNTPTTQARVKVSDAATGTPSDMSDADFTISALPTINVTSPNGGESWCVESTHNITWTSTGTIENVKLEYSTNSGSEWITIAASTANDGTHSWVIPNTSSSTCLVKASEAATGTPSDVSNALFTIAAQVITVTSPNGGEVWQAGTNQNIAWTSSCFTGNVELEYSTDGGSSWITIIASTANDGTHSWSVPNTPSENCLVKISDAADGVPYDQSDAIFTISPPPEDMLTLTSPNGGETWNVGSVHNITWTYQGLVSDVKLEYSTDAGTNWVLITASTSNDGAYSWTIPDTPSESCLVKITDVSNSETSDISDDLFTIFKPVVSGCKILFDRSHGFNSGVDTTYWSHLISGLRSAGHEVVTDQTDFDLSGYSVVFLSMPAEDYSSTELSALQSFVQSGGGLVLSAEHSGGFGTAYLNNVANLFGINFKSNVVYDDVHNDQAQNIWPIITDYVAHPTTEGITQTVIYAGASIELSGSAYAVAYADTGAYILPTLKGVVPSSPIYPGVYKNGDGEHSFSDDGLDIVVMAASEYGAGKVWAVGDFNIWADDYEAQDIGIDYYDNQELALNVFDWVCTPKEIVGVPVLIPDTCVKLGDFILIPIEIGDVTGKGVYSAEITLTYDDAILQATDATLTGTIAEGWGMMVYNLYDGKVEIGISGTTPLSGSGVLVYVGFNVLTLPQNSTIIHFERMRFNEGIPPAEATDGIITSCEVYQISGLIRYCLNENPVKDATVAIKGGINSSVSTDASGGYSFLNLSGGLDYTVKPEKTDDAGDAITAYDASLVLRNVVHLISLSACQQLSADVTGNCEVSAYDASYILRYVVGEITQFPIGEDWKFFPASYVLDSVLCVDIPDSIFYASLSSNMFNQDFRGILYGDVSGNWTGEIPLYVQEKASLPKVNSREFSVKPGEEFILPIELSEIPETYSAEFSLDCNASWLEVKGVSLSEQTSGFMMEDKIEGNQISIALAGAKAVGSGVFVNVAFKVSENVREGEGTEIRLTSLRINESQKVEINLAYLVTVGNSVPARFSLSQNHPNPFNPATTIEYSLPTKSFVALEIYNLLGQKVVTLVNQEIEAGVHQVVWDGKDNQGNKVSSGVYFYRIKTDNFSEVKKMVMMK